MTDCISIETCSDISKLLLLFENLVVPRNYGKSNKLYYYLKPTDSPALRCYVQPKIHKPGVPNRPVFSYSGSPLYSLTKSIANILKSNALSQDSNVKNSNTFYNYMRNVPIEDDDVIVSFVVTSLNTNIDTLNMIKDYVHNNDQYT